jgi:site-specific recombinase XerD
MKQHPLGPYLRRFLLEETCGDRNLSLHTQRSYRDTFRLLLHFLNTEHRLEPAHVTVEHVDADTVRSFLQHLEATRRCGSATRNQRLAAVRSLYRYIAEQEPALVAHAASVRQIRFRRVAPPTVAYLEKPELDAVLAVPDRHTDVGLRDYALLLFLYNTGARASEAVAVTPRALLLDSPPSVRLFGKGRKQRHCPLWPHTAKVLRALLATRTDATETSAVFLNVRGEPLTRFGIHALVARIAARAIDSQPSLREKRVSPHTIRHTTAVHLLRAGVDINTIRGWLGHVSLETTNRYAEIDLEMKAKALETCATSGPNRRRTKSMPWQRDRDLMTFLTSL